MTSKKGKMVPEIRFKGFNDGWEQRKVGEFSEMTYGGSTPKTSNSHFWNGNIPWIQSSDLEEHKLYDVTPKKSITENAIEKSAAKVIPENSIAIVTRVGVGKLAFMPYEYATSQDFLSLSKLKVNQWFAVYSLYKKLQSELSTVQGTSIKGITKAELLDKKLLIPTNFAEQQSIGAFFKSLDDTITLHQRKLALLQQVKQTLLTLLFPEKGTSVPQVRFSSFTETWKKKKLGDFLSIPEKKVAAITKTSDLLTVKLNLGGIVAGSTRETLNLGATKYYKRFAGQLIYGKQNFFNGSMAIIPTYLDGKATSGDVPSFNINGINRYFLFIFISRTKYWKEKESKAIGTGSKRIHEKTFMKFSIDTPSNDEQNELADLFTKLDAFINFHQSKLELLKKSKISLLKEMFI